LDGAEYAPQAPLMEAIQAELGEATDFIGPVLGQCVDSNSRERTFVAFKAPFGVTSAALSFLDQQAAFEVVWPDITQAPATPTPVTYGSVVNANINVRSCSS